MSFVNGKVVSRMRNWWRRLNNSYRLTVLEDESLEEVVSLQLTKKTLYIGICTLAVVLVLITGILLSMSPLKYYIPGYGDPGRRKAYIGLNMKVDSLEKVVSAQTRYLNNVQSVLHGQVPAPDTTLLKIPEPESSGE